MRIQHNIMAMNAYRNYSSNVSAMQKNLEKLSSGYKINRAGDDAAGLAISEKMRAQITGLETAQKNAKDGISLVQTAEGALTEVHDMLNRMVELATQSANGTYDVDTDRAQMQKELDQLRSEIDRIADSANFNGIKLLNGALDAGGGATKGGISIADPGTTLGANTLLHTSGTAETTSTFTLDLDTLTWNAKNGDSLEINLGDETITLTATEDATYDAEDLAGMIATQFALGTDAGGLGGQLDGKTATAAADGTSVKFTAAAAGEAAGFAVNRDITMTVNFADGSAPQTRSIGRAGEGGGESDGTPAKVEGSGANNITVGGTVTGDSAATATVTIDLTGTVGDGETFKVTSSGGTISLNMTATYTAASTSWAVTGAPEGYTAAFDNTTKVLTLTATDKGQTGTQTSDFGTVAVANGDGNTGLNAVAINGSGGFAFTDGSDGTVTGGITVNTTTLDADAIKTEAAKNEAITAGKVEIKKNTADNKLLLTVNGVTVGTSTAEVTGAGDVTFTTDGTAGGTALGKITLTGTLSDASAFASAVDAQFTYTPAGPGGGDEQVETSSAEVDLSTQLDTVDLSDKTNQLTSAELTALQNAYGPDADQTVTVNSDITVDLAGFAASLTGTPTVQQVADAIKAAAQTAVDTWKATDEGQAANYTYTNIRVENSEGTELSSRAAATGKFVIKMDKQVDDGGDETPAGGTKGLSGNFNAASTNNQKGLDAGAGQYASTTFNLSDMGTIGDGSTITIAGETYTFKEGDDFAVDTTKNTITLTKTKTGDARLEEAARGLSQMSNDTFTIGSEDPESGKIVLDEKVGASAEMQEKLSDFDDFEDLITYKTVTPEDTTRGLKLQIGDTAEDFNQLRVSIGDAHCDALGIDAEHMSIANQDDAAEAVDMIKAAINRVSDIRGTLGATQNRLDHTMNNLSVMTENIQDAESTIRDVDVAEEMMAYTKNNILIQSAQAMLAQANQVPQGVLQLLG